MGKTIYDRWTEDSSLEVEMADEEYLNSEEFRKDCELGEKCLEDEDVKILLGLD